MIKEGYARELRRLLDAGKSLSQSARMTDMDRKTARKYRDNPMLPNAQPKERNYRTRLDPFAGVWDQVQRKLEADPKLKSYALFAWLQDAHPEQFPDSMRRTFERRVAKWKKLHGPGKNVVIEQVHKPGQLAASDFTVCNSLGVTIAGARFDHTLFHCVLTYSNFESVTLCYSESFEALSTGIQNAFFQFGGVPKNHRTDSLAAAIRNHSSKKQLTERFQALMAHYGCEPQRTNPRCANENGDVESLNGKLKDRIDQALRIRGSRDFKSIEQYVAFLDTIVDRANSNRVEKFREDEAALRALPCVRLETDDLLTDISVSKSSTIRVRSQVYSVPSRLIDTKVNVRVTIDSIIVSVGDDVVERMPRLIGKNTAAINYRHIIDSLVRKPGAFKNYRYHEQSFPRTIFRIAYDALGEKHTERVQARIYLEILHLAAHESEEATAQALNYLIDQDLPIEVERVKSLVAKASELPRPTDVDVPEVDLQKFDDLIFGNDNTNDRESQNGANEKDATASGRQAEDDFKGDAFKAGREVDGDACQSVPGASPTDVPRSLREFGGESGSGGLLAYRVSIGTDDARDRSPSGGTGEAVDDAEQTSAGQDVVELRLRSVAAECDAQAGDTSGGSVLGCEGKRPAVRQAGLGKKPRVMRTGRATDSSRSQHPVHDLQSAGTAATASQAGVASSSDAQDACGIRRPDHRRPGLRAAEPGGDGSAVHASGRTIRAGQRDANEQPSIQQMGSDLQRRDDNRRRDRSLGTPQRDHRNERSQLPSGNGQEEPNWTVSGQLNSHYEFLIGEF